MAEVKHLINELIPSSYSLTIEPDYDSLDFTGKVVIRAKKPRLGKSITLHGKDLKVRNAYVRHGGKRYELDCSSSGDELTLKCDQDLKGDLEINIQYSGHVSDQLHGIYPSRYKVQGQNKLALATQLESHHAREVFPCIDEPEAKATFAFTLIAPAKHRVISNTPIKNKSLLGSKQTVEFETTPIMSTYLFAFISGELEFVKGQTKRGTEVKVWTTEGKKEQGKFALDVGIKSLEFYEDYFKIDYPLSKCDMVALPDFVTGAMENWGCVLYRETALLVDKNTSLQGRQRIAIVVAHELAHQWFGNLVTMRWWTDLWLNEGFASWIEYKVVDKLFPEWNIWTDFVTDAVFRGQALDSLASSHPVEVPIEDPDDIRSIFDAISYEKGASLIRMLEDYIGEDEFQKGLSYYLDKHSYGNASTNDLWHDLEVSSKLPVDNFMSVWTKATGFPFIRLSSDFNAVQERFLLKANGRSDTIWPVPLINGTDQVLDKKDAIVKYNDGSPLLNRGRKGFYYTSYSKQHLGELGETIVDGKLSVDDRLGLLHESFELAKSGNQSTADVLDLLESYESEDRAPVWQVIASIIGDTRRVFDDDTIRDNLKGLSGKLAKKQLSRLGKSAKDSDDHNDLVLRPLILSLAAFAEDNEVLEYAKTLFKDVLDGKHIDPDLKNFVYATVAKHGNANDYEAMIHRHNQSDSSAERMKLAVGVTAFRQEALIKTTLEFIKSDHVRSQDVYFWIAYIFSNRNAKQLAWQWLKDNWQWIEERFASDIATFAYMPKFASRGFSSKEFAEDYQLFFKQVNPKGINLQIEQGLEHVLWQAAWKERDYKEVSKFLAKS